MPRYHLIRQLSRRTGMNTTRRQITGLQNHTRTGRKSLEPISCKPSFFTPERPVSNCVVKIPENLETIYRVDTLNFKSNHTGNPEIILTPLELALAFRLSSNPSPDGQDVVNHQKSAYLIGATSEYTTAQKLYELWKNDRNAILKIATTPGKSHLIDVDRTVSRMKTRFYTQISEKEVVFPFCRIFDIESVDIGRTNQTIKNPLYIPPDRGNSSELYENQRDFFNGLYFDGHSLTKHQRQKALSDVIEITSDFYEETIDNANPLKIPLNLYQHRYGNEQTQEQLRSYSPNQTLLDVLTKHGDDLFMQNRYYKQLVGGNVRNEIIARDNLENGYGPRNSYSFE